MEDDWQSGIGLGWFLEKTEDQGVVVHHRGRAAGHCAYLGLLPDRGIGVVVVANRGGRQPSRDLLALGLQMLEAAGAPRQTNDADSLTPP